MKIDVNIKLKGTSVCRWKYHRNDSVEIWFYDIWNTKRINQLITIVNSSNDDEIYENLLAIIKKWNQPYALIIKTRVRVLAFTDHFQSYTLFYHISDNKTIITDFPQQIVNQENATICEQNIPAFMFTRYTFGSRTLINNLYQIPAGQYLCVSKNKHELRHHYLFQYEDNGAFNHIEKQKELKQILVDVFSDLLKLSEGRQLVLLFSGGYDSRLILWALDFIKAPNVLLCSYGRWWQRDVKWAKEFAEFVPYPWVHVKKNYRTRKSFYQSSLRKKYYRETHKFCRKPYIMDLAAVNHLKQNRLITDDAIFINGMCGGFISGGVLNKNLLKPISLDKQVEMICKKHCVMWNWNHAALTSKKIVKSQIMADLKKAPVNCKNAGNLYEWWVWRERLTKLMVSSADELNWMGYQLAMPLWDKRLVEFFKSIPFEERLGQKFFISFIQDLKTSSGKYFTEAPHTIRDKPHVFLKLRRLLEYLAHPRWNSYTVSDIRSSKKIAKQTIGTGKLAKQPQVMGISNGLLMQYLTKKYNIRS